MCGCLPILVTNVRLWVAAAVSEPAPVWLHVCQLALLSGCTCVCWPSCLVARAHCVWHRVWLCYTSGIADWLVGWLVGWLVALSSVDARLYALTSVVCGSCLTFPTGTVAV